MKRECPKLTGGNHRGPIVVTTKKENPPRAPSRAFQARKFLAKGYLSYLAYVVDAKVEKKKVDDVEVVRDYPDIFPEDLSGLPL
ncbi:hypothetical protein L6452_32587 [Arctium lappa]|uniref:Uncharacterized protein n=1 Tax=Arctium lappa TaxID=4217 RepID=A0ACB8Z4Y0_ARCLA|nr:hypothetical protein L6452_32587 [Arctium lappa]